jgi:hypothetical protein
MSELEKCMNALEIMGKDLVKKSIAEKPVSARVARAMAISRASKTPAGAIIAKRVIQLQRQQVLRKAAGMPEDDGAAEDQIRRELRQIQQREKLLRAKLREIVYDDVEEGGEADDWSSQFSEA